MKLADMKLAGVTVPLVVADAGAKGRGVFYAGAESLAAGTVVSLYRCLLVRADVLRAWRADSTVSADAWAFWREYAIEFAGEGGQRWTDQWMALPGLRRCGSDPISSYRRLCSSQRLAAHAFGSDATAVGDAGELDAPSWWRHGTLSGDALGGAMGAVEARRLVSWQRPAHTPSLGTLMFNAHLINAPPPVEQGPAREERCLPPWTEGGRALHPPYGTSDLPGISPVSPPYGTARGRKRRGSLASASPYCTTPQPRRTRRGKLRTHVRAQEPGPGGAAENVGGMRGAHCAEGEAVSPAISPDLPRIGE